MGNSEIINGEEGIAIIGMAGRFPGARDVEEFRRNLENGVESISFFSEQELEEAGVSPARLRDPNYVRAQAILGGVELFDANFFGFNPREAEMTDPQHRLLLECAWEALENAGYDSGAFEGAIGLFAGASLNTYLLNNLISNQSLISSVGGLQTSVRNRTDHLTTHVAYKLNLKGPAVTVQTACSTSLVATHLACQSLFNYQCDIALSGGVTVSVPEKAGYVYQEGGINSPDGHCRAFDAEAKGTVSGSGAGVVVLKRLADALADGDHIHAVIKGTAINNDGSVKVGYTAPSVQGQAEVIAMAQAVAGVEPETVTYVEAHGTGTPLGDPIEMQALTKVFRAATRKKNFCAVGSLKSNIGHLDTAAGVAGLIKTVLSLQQKKIFPSLHFKKPNPQLGLADSPFYISDRLAEWEAGRSPRRAGVSSFGIGGTNAHLVVEEAPPAAPSGEAKPWQLLLLSAKTGPALEAMTANLMSHLKQRPGINLADAAYTLHAGRRAFNHRRAIVCQGVEDAIQAVEILHPEKVLTGLQEPRERPVAFMFPGQGAQRPGMGAELYRTERVFREQIDLCSKLLEPHLGFNLREVLYPGQQPEGVEPPDLKQTHVTQPALFAVEYALAQLWMSWGVRPRAMVGHSLGEYVAACLAGVMTLEEALMLVAARGRLMRQLPEGAMLAVPLPEKDVSPLLGGQLSLAAVNTPSLCVVSGPVEAVRALEERMSGEGVACRPLSTSHAFHSEMMTPMLEPFLGVVRQINFRPPQVPYLSNVSGTWITADEATDPDYWVRHIRQTVRFSEAAHELFKDPDWVLLEVGPGRTLMNITRWHPYKAQGQVVLTSLTAAGGRLAETPSLLAALSRLWLVGINIDREGFYSGQKRRRVPLPTYPFERRRYWVEPRRQAGEAADGQEATGKRADISEWFYVPAWRRTPAPAPGLPAEREMSWLIFLDECGLGSKLAGRLEELGRRVITVSAGGGFGQSGPDAYTVNPREGGDYHALLKELRSRGRLPTHVAHLWSVTPDEEQAGGEGLSGRHLDGGFYSLLFLAQALGAEGVAEGTRVGIISNNMQEVTGEERLCPEKAAVLGPCKVIPQEYAALRCVSVDVSLPVAGSEHERALVNNLIAELSTTSGEPVVAYRARHRWVQDFEPERRHHPEAVPLREGGVYLITGGLGGIGFVLAKYIAGAVRARLLLVGRTALPARREWERRLEAHEEDEVCQKIRRVRELEELGAEVMVVAADVADRARMEEAVAEARARFGRIDGVVHAAGVPGGGMIQLRTPELAADVLAPKVQGTRVIASLVNDMKPDFFVLCSSRSSILGGFGGVDYSAANAFLDAFAHDNSARHEVRTVSVNWPGWREVGMLAEAAARYGAGGGGAARHPRALDHPLLHKQLKETPSQEVYSTEYSVATHWVLDDHRIVSSAVIPGTAYLEMARAALEKHAGGREVELQDVFFLTPTRVRDDERREVRTYVEKGDGLFEFKMSAGSPAGNGSRNGWQDCVIGKMRVVSSPEAAKRYDIGALKEKCGRKEIVITDDHVKRDDDLGPRWQSLKAVYLGDKELLAALELPAEFSDDLVKYKLHPALLDRANGTARDFLVGKGEYLPLSYKRLRVKRPLPRKLYAYARYRDEAGGDDKEIITFDLVLLDEHGEELVQVEEFSQKRVNNIVGQIKALTGSAPLPKSGRREAEEPAEHAGEPQAAAGGFEKTLGEAITPQEGVEVFTRILAGGAAPQVVVSPDDLRGAIRRAREAKSQAVAAKLEEIQTVRTSHPRPNVSTSYAAPRNETERSIAAVWQEVLGIEQVGVHDNFFDLGGDSVQAIQIMTKATKSGLQLTVQQLFQYQTIAELAAASGGAEGAGGGQDARSEPIPLTPAQHLLFAACGGNPPSLTRRVVLDTRAEIDPELLRQALAHLHAQHDALRLRFERGAEGWRQFETGGAEGADALAFFDLSEAPAGERESVFEEKAAELQTRLDITQGTLLCAAFFGFGREAGGRLLLLVHGLAADDYSVKVLLEDLQDAYERLRRGEQVRPAPGTLSYRRGAARLSELAQSAETRRELPGWQRAAFKEVSRLPADKPAGRGGARADFVRMSLDAGETHSLLNEVPKAYRTQTEEVLLAALASSLARWSGARSLKLHLGRSLRELLSEGADASRTAGNFGTLAPVVLELPAAPTPGDLLKSVKEQLRAVPNRGVGFGLLYFADGEARQDASLKALAEAEVRFRHLEELGEAMPARAPFRPLTDVAEEANSGVEEGGPALDFSWYVAGGRLHLACGYGEELFHRATAERLVEDFFETLKALIGHCLSPQAGGFTPSDFPLANLDEQKLDVLQSLLDRLDASR